MEQSRKRASFTTHTSLVVALVASLLIGLYPHIRHGGYASGGGDAQRFTTWISGVQASASIVPDTGAYGNGYGYQALAIVSHYLGGIEIGHFQLYLGTLLIAWTLFLAWLFYRAITRSAVGAAIATFILLLQPEFLFALLRGTHEKFTRGLMFLCLLLLVQSVLSRRRPRRFAGLLIAFYLAVYALITFNNLLAISFVTALALSLLLSLLVQRLARAPSGGDAGGDGAATRRRLFYATAIALLLAFLFTFYAYEPARHSILLVDSIVDRLALLFLDLETAAVNPYQTVTNAWISVPVYFVVSIANWLLLIVSFVLWSAQTIRWGRDRSWPDESRAFLLWSLYGAFGFLGAVSIAVDVSGAIAGNLQHRIFPSFAMIAAAVVADWFVRRPALGPATRRVAYGALAVAVAFLAVVALAKATNEPSLSNKWNYYTPAEFTALEWARAAKPNAATWTAFDERLRAAVGICCAREFDTDQLDGFRPDPATRDYLLSGVIRARSVRLGLPLPIGGDSLRVYDNGGAELYHLRPRTPFQK